MIGRVVARVRYLSEDELKNEGWTGRVTAIEFTDGFLLYASSDGEGNYGGVLVISTPGGKSAFVAPTSQSVQAEARP